MEAKPGPINPWLPKANPTAHRGIEVQWYPAPGLGNQREGVTVAHRAALDPPPGMAGAERDAQFGPGGIRRLYFASRCQ